MKELCQNFLGVMASLQENPSPLCVRCLLKEPYVRFVVRFKLNVSFNAK